MVSPPSDDDLDGLRQRVDALATVCRRLLDANRRQQSELEQLRQERQGLISRHEQARNRVEALITRLKSLEPGP